MAEDPHTESYCAERVWLVFWRKDGSACGRSEAARAELQIYIATIGRSTQQVFSLPEQMNMMDSAVSAYVRVFNAGKVERSRELLAVLSEGSKSA